MSEPTVAETTSRDRVLSAAHQLMLDHGYVDFSMRELAEVSGLAKATIYHHFPDKQTICNAVVDIEFADLRDRIKRAAASAQDPVERLRAVINEMLGPELERRLVIVFAAQEMTGLGMQFQKHIKRYRLEIVAPVADIIRDGIEQGAFRPLNVDMTVISLLGTMHSYITHRLVSGPNEQLSGIVDHTIDLFLNGLLPRSGSA